MNNEQKKIDIEIHTSQPPFQVTVKCCVTEKYKKKTKKKKRVEFEVKHGTRNSKTVCYEITNE